MANLPTHGFTECLEIMLAIKMDGVLFQDKVLYFSKKMCSYRRISFMEIFVCLTY